ncbi:PREDICTED: photosystem I subunit O-like, partial [Populus euphratica]|uniref:Photosystem I subunit O-like n=1 Tax=Populus euphratica TaxID=75702 RepID=A0AAJ6T4B1_POPEU
TFLSNKTTKESWQPHLLAYQLLQGWAVAHFHPLLGLLRQRKSASSGFVKSPVAAGSPLRLAGAHGGKFMCFERDWLRKDLNVIGFGLIGWLAPSSIPANGGKSLSGLFFESIGTELAHFPTPPPLTSQFWLWLVTWHLGLFICLTLGQIGFKGRADEYF